MSHQSFQFGLPDDAQGSTSLAAASSNAASPNQGIRTNSPAPLRFNNDGTVDRLDDAGSSRVNMANTSNGEGGILGTARAKDGGRACPTAELRPDNRVTLPDGSETTVAVAERLGYLRRDENTGRYSEVAQAAAEVQEPVAKDPDGEDIAFAAPQAEARFSALAQATKSDPGSQMKAVLEMTETGTISPTTLNRLASVAGVHPSQIGADIGKVIETFSEQAHAHVEKSGTSAEDFFEWAREMKPRELKEAARTHATLRQPGAYSGPVAQYHANLESYDPHAILQAKFGSGITAHQDGNRVILTIPGVGQMPYSSAVKGGLIKVGATKR